MAYLKNPLDDDQNQQQGQAQTPSTSGVIDGQTQPGASTGAPAPTTGADQRTPGTGFVNLQAYLGANKDEGGRMVNQTNSGVVNDVNNFQSGAAKTVADQSQALASQNGSGQIGKLKSGIVDNASGNLSAATDFLGKGIDVTGANAAKSQLGATRSDLDSRLGQVGDLGTQVAGLQNTYGKGPSPYSLGFSNLDQFLETGTKSGQDATKALVGRTADVDRSYGVADRRIDHAVADAQRTRDANKKDLTTTAQDRLGNIVASGRKGVANLNRGLDTTNYDGTAQASLGDAISPEDQTNLAALANIAGGKVDDSWKAKTFNRGTIKPPPPPPPPDSTPAAPPPDTSGITNPKNPNNPTNTQPITPLDPLDNLPPVEILDPGNLIPDGADDKVNEALKNLPGVPKLRKHHW